MPIRASSSVIFSENRAHDAAFHSQRRAVCRGRKRAGHERNHGRDFVCPGKPLQERSGSYRPEELALHFSARVFFDFAMSARNFSTPSERVGPASTELSVTPVPAVVAANLSRGFVGRDEARLSHHDENLFVGG